VSQFAVMPCSSRRGRRLRRTAVGKVAQDAFFAASSIELSSRRNKPLNEGNILVVIPPGGHRLSRLGPDPAAERPGTQAIRLHSTARDCGAPRLERCTAPLSTRAGVLE